jgi:haloacetate dehalogenase
VVRVPLLAEFSNALVAANETRIHVARAGSGPPILLLHGYPQTHVMWHRVAPALADRFTVVCTDLRGYGDSSKPLADEGHVAYSKRTMARDQLEVMRSLGFDRFAVVAHDRGARVALRMALDHPDAVTRLAIVDIVPTAVIYGTVDDSHARTLWRYFFLTQPFDLPERLIGSSPEFYLRWTLDEWCSTPGALADEAIAEYVRGFDAGSIHATCEDYRAGATIDLIHDKEDADQPLRCPLLVLWSAGGLGQQYDVEMIWRRRAADFRGRAIDCGHFIAEERADETVTELRSFLA